MYDYDDQASEWETEESTNLKFVYDQWNVVMVLDGTDSDTIETKYTWGLDMSGLSGQSPERERGVYGIHGAGGIGGLLAVEETSTGGTPEYWFLYDGNGNVGQVLDASDQSIDAKYEYTPYGNEIVATGTYAATNPFRFSTKYLDTEQAGVASDSVIGDTGLHYYGYRYYSPNLGRWLNRDPVGELGGMNLYGFLNNEPLSRLDPHGRFIIDVGAGLYQLMKCRCCLKKNKNIVGDANDKLNSWMNETGNTNLCDIDAMQHCLGGALAGKKCGETCARIAGILLELQQLDFDPVDLHNNEEGAKCGSAPDIVACCEDKLKNDELRDDGKCQ